jgi:hypothetical protein
MNIQLPKNKTLIIHKSNSFFLSQILSLFPFSLTKVCI